VTVEVLKAPAERTLRDLPVHLRGLAPGLSAQAVPSVVNVGLRGSREGLNRVEADDIVVYVDLSGLGSGQYPLTVRADTSNEAGVTRVEPATVQVRIASVK
jgi:YbbR domain-containing protein